jgi:hypothetical protein
MEITVAVMAEHTPDTFSRIIMKWLGVKYSHVAIIYNGMVYHAIQKGVCCEPFSEVSKVDYIFDSLDVRLNVTKDYFNGFMKGCVGRDYCETQLVGYAFSPIKKLVSDGRREFTCSEFGAWVLECMAGYKWEENLDFVDPKEFLDKVKEVEGKKAK